MIVEWRRAHEGNALPRARTAYNMYLTQRQQVLAFLSRRGPRRASALVLHTVPTRQGGLVVYTVVCAAVAR